MILKLMFTKRNFVIALVILILIGGFWYWRGRKQEKTLPTEVVRRGNVTETVSVTGAVVPERFAELSFQKTGIVEQVLVKEGDFVREGQIIALLDSSVLQSQLNEARLAQKVAEEDEKLARRNHWKKLAPEERATKKLASERAREDVRTIAEQTKERVLTAPFEGWISALDIKTGETAAVDKVIARIAAAGDKFIIEARVPESDIAKITTDTRARVTFDAFPADEIFDAAVSEIDTSATVVQDVVFYVVKFSLIKMDERLKDGMTANLDIETAKKENVLVAPFRALVKENGKTYAQVKRANGAFEKVEVITGLEGDEGLVEIKSGLKEGDEVATSATQAL